MISSYFRESPAELIGMLDLSPLYTNPALGARAGPSQAVCRDLAFYSPFRRAQGEQEQVGAPQMLKCLGDF